MSRPDDAACSPESEGGRNVHEGGRRDRSIQIGPKGECAAESCGEKPIRALQIEYCVPTLTQSDGHSEKSGGPKSAGDRRGCGPTWCPTPSKTAKCIPNLGSYDDGAASSSAKHSC